MSMIQFGVAVALLTIVALWLVMRPLLSRRASGNASRNGVNIALYREQLREVDEELKSGAITPDEHARARRELEARLLEDVGDGEGDATAVRPARRTALILAFTLPVGALLVYLVVGAPLALDPSVVARDSAEHSVDRQQLEAMVETLAARLKENPDNAEGWVMLARSYKHFQRYADAARAYGNAVARLPANADVLTDYADVLAMAQGQKLAGEPEKLIQRALKLDPRHFKALALAGSVAFEKKDYALAANYWEQMLPLVPPASDQARTIQANVDEARGLGGIAGAARQGQVRAEPGAPAVAADSAPGAANSALTGTVKLAPELVGKVAPTDSVLIYARPAEGSRMPLAIMRREARDLPVSFQLDDTSAMQPGMTLSKYEKVIVAARVSKSPSAMAQPGDLEGMSVPVANTARGVTIVIDREVR